MEQKLRRTPVLILTVLLAAAAFLLRRNQLKTAFDEIGVIAGKGGLFIWVTAVVILLFALYAFFLRGRKKYNAISSRNVVPAVLSCAAALLITCIAQGYNLFGYGISAAVVGLLLAVFSTILGHSIFSWCLKYFSPSFVSASKLCEPVVAAVLAAVLFAEIPGVWQVIGGALILGGVLFYSRIEGKE